MSTTIRQIAAEDISNFLSLHEEVLGDPDFTRDTFEWKYGSNPYTKKEYPVMVAVDEGDIVGAAGFIPYQLGHAEERYRAVQPADVMVKDEYRNQPVFMRMVKQGINQFTTSEEIRFGFPAPQTRSVWTRLFGWELVDQIPRAVRVKNLVPTANAIGSDKLRALAYLTWPALRLGYGVLDSSIIRRAAEPTPKERLTTLSGGNQETAEILGELYNCPTQFHFVRDSKFYEWRLSRPNVKYTAHVVAVDNEPTAALVTAEPQSRNRLIIADFLPLTGTRDTLLRRLLANAVLDAQSPEVELSPQLPPAVWRRFGFMNSRWIERLDNAEFVSDDLINRLPEPWWADIVVGVDQEFKGPDPTEPGSWIFTNIEHDTI